MLKRPVSRGRGQVSKRRSEISVASDDLISVLFRAQCIFVLLRFVCCWVCFRLIVLFFFLLFLLV